MADDPPRTAPNPERERARLHYEELRADAADRIKYQVEYRHAALRGLTIVNGGAIIALFTFIGNDRSAVLHLNPTMIWWALREVREAKRRKSATAPRHRGAGRTDYPDFPGWLRKRRALLCDCGGLRRRSGRNPEASSTMSPAPELRKRRQGAPASANRRPRRSDSG